MSELIHGTCVAIATPVGPLGVLLRGPSGAGKSDLALRLIDAGGWLIADDQTEVEVSGDGLLARAPASLSGLLEVRGLGITGVPHLAQAPLGLIVDLVEANAVERLPEEDTTALLGVEVPLLALAPFEASSVAKLRLAARARARSLGAAADGPQAPPGAEPPATVEGPLPVVLVTGMSGAGKTLALKTLEDLGYETIDNLPLRLFQQVVRESGRSRPLAIGADTRGRDFAATPLVKELEALVADPELTVTLLVLDCDDEILQRRFTETRRRHPLAKGRPLADGLAAERRLLAPLRDRADLVLDTSLLSAPEFREALARRLALSDGQGLALFVTSFSFRRGLPREADLVLDVRFLRNPHYQAALRPLSGRDVEVSAYVQGDPAFAGFFSGLTDLLGPLLPRYESEGKSYLTIAVGCTGGRHRSVAVAERLVEWLESGGRGVTLVHRDLVEEVSATTRTASRARQ